MRAALLLLAMILLAGPGWATDGDRVKDAEFGGVSVKILCDAAAVGDCANVDMKDWMGSTRIDAIAVSLITQAGGTCTIVPKGRNSPTGTAIDLSDTDLTVLGTAEKSYESWWRYIYATVSGAGCTATVYLKAYRGN